MTRRLRSQAACMASAQRGFGAFFDTLERPSPAMRALSGNAATLRRIDEETVQPMISGTEAER